MIEFLVVLGFAWIIAAVVQDLKYREIANWLNFSLIIFAIVFRLFYSIFSGNYDFILMGIFGLGVFFVLGNLLYYARLFAGGDAKLFISFGAVIPFAGSYYLNTLIFFVFLISLLAGGALYSLIYSVFLVIKNKKEFSREFSRNFRNFHVLFISLMVFLGIFIVYSLITENFIIILFPLFLAFTFLLYIYAKAIEKSCMLSYVKINKLTIGDWLAKPIKINGKNLEPHWEGLTQKQIDLIKKYYKKDVLIKQGIPFSPAFLIAFIVIVYIRYLGNADWGFWQIRFFF